MNRFGPVFRGVRRFSQVSSEGGNEKILQQLTQMRHEVSILQSEVQALHKPIKTTGSKVYDIQTTSYMILGLASLSFGYMIGK